MSTTHEIETFGLSRSEANVSQIEWIAETLCSYHQSDKFVVNTDRTKIRIFATCNGAAFGLRCSKA